MSNYIYRNFDFKIHKQIGILKREIEIEIEKTYIRTTIEKVLMRCQEHRYATSKVETNGGKCLRQTEILDGHN